jgi:peroxiredoxin
MALEVGQEAPDFVLKDEHGQLFRLSELRGERNIVLIFYPYAFSGICSGELCEIRDHLAVFEAENVQVAAISCDAVYALRAWAEEKSYAFPLLSDYWPHGEVARSYGVFNESTGAAKRGTFLVDLNGTIRWIMVNGPGEARPMAAYRAAISGL